MSVRRGRPVIGSLRPHLPPVALAALVAGAAACAPAEHVLMLEVRSQADVDTLHVEVLRLDGSGPPTERMERVNRSRDSINNEEPIRIAISFPGPADVVVYVRAESGDTPPRTLLATRCYSIAGVVRDDVLLVQLDASADEDGDGFPRQSSATCRDLAPDGTVEACDIGACEDAVAADCDDDPTDDPVGATVERRNRAADRYPGAPFFCIDGIDQNCRIDDAALTDGDEPCEDRDDDMWQACSFETSTGVCDCDDTNPAINPDAMDMCGDGIDSDCSGAEALCDRDGDTVPADRPVGGAPDCDDENPAVSPLEIEDCDTPIDDNCNRLVNEGCTDGDLDNDGSPACPVGVTTCTTCDCNDCNAAVRPGATDICDGLDNVTGAAAADCAGDTDRDGQLPPIDCAPDDARIYQSAPERCGDGSSENCVDPPMACTEGTDADGDMYTLGARGQDCDDTDPLVAPFAPEVCNDLDDDCDGLVNEHGRALDDGGCVFDPRIPACGGAGACEIEFRAAAGNTDHCGGCGVACNPGATTVADVCVSGVCGCSSAGAACVVGDTCCVGVRFSGCYDLTDDAENCGFCGMVCDTREAPDCTGSSCTCDSNGAPCAAGLDCCGDGCHDLSSDNANCGACGLACGAGSHCNGAGACVCDNPDLFDCNSDLSAFGNNGCEARIDQVNRCGACTTNCMTTNVAVAACGGSPGSRTCAITSCNAGFADCNLRTNDGCETPLNTTSNCRACGTVCNPMNATAACEAGGCGYSSCNAGFGDCDGNRVNGCETPLNTTSNCRGCGTVCNPMNATAACEVGGCGFSACNTDFGNCDGNRVNGCEAAINTATSCGACGTNCNSLANVNVVACGGSPGARVCTITSCDANFANCDSMSSTGCETPLRTLTDCTGCGDVCGFTNAAESCGTGACVMGACAANFADCDSMSSTGCETPLRTLTDCTGCGVACSIPNAAESCATGACVMGACTSGFLNCDAMSGNGCETTVSGTACGSGCVDCESHTHVASATCSNGGSTGTCNYVCDAGWADCTGAPGCETDITTTTACGACGNACGTDSGAGAQAETCVDSGGGVYRCSCRSVTATGPGQACPGADLCCASGMACQMTCM